MGLDLIIHNGTIVDGTGIKPYRADIGIADRRIAAIGDLRNATAHRSIDASGCYVGPGFIDTHTHFDAQIFRDKTCSDAGQNGITTVVMANCGFGFAPCHPEHRTRYMMMMESVEQIPVSHQEASLPWDWESFPEFIASLKRTPKSVNALMYCPLNPLMIYVMGIDAAKTRAATPAEMAEMKRLLGEAMDAGAAGLSLSHLGRNNVHLDYDGSPMPTDLMSIDQACELAAYLGERGEGVVQCLSGVAGVSPTVEMSERLAEASGRPVLHNVIPTSDSIPTAHVPGVNWLEKMAAEGKDMYAASFCSRQWIEFTLATSTMHDGDPTFRELSYAESQERRMELLADPEFRTRLREAYSPSKFVVASGVIEDFTLLAVGDTDAYAEHIDRRLGEIAKEKGVHAVDVYADINFATKCEATFKSSMKATNPDTVRSVFLNDRIIPGGSDGGAHIKIFNGGQWATDFMVNLVRDKKAVTIEQAHFKMSYMPMRLMGVRDRGALLEGMAADILVYDLDELYHDTSRFDVVHDMPHGDWRRRPRAGGYRWIVVNGEITFDGKNVTDAAPGQYIDRARTRRESGGDAPAERIYEPAAAE